MLHFKRVLIRRVTHVLIKLTMLERGCSIQIRDPSAYIQLNTTSFSNSMSSFWIEMSIFISKSTLPFNGNVIQMRVGEEEILYVRFIPGIVILTRKVSQRKKMISFHCGLVLLTLMTEVTSCTPNPI